jgi:hypothetical protein
MSMGVSEWVSRVSVRVNGGAVDSGVRGKRVCERVR